MKPTCKKLREFIKDEKDGSKLYIKYGFPKLAKDESRHRRFLLKKMKKMKCR
jgi:hypothetical protein